MRAIARNESYLPHSDLLEEDLSLLKLASRKSDVRSEAASLAEGRGGRNESQKLHILIIDADSEDPRLVVSCHVLRGFSTVLTECNAVVTLRFAEIEGLEIWAVGK